MKITRCRDCGTERTRKETSECWNCGSTTFVACYTKDIAGGKTDCNENMCPHATSPEVCDYARAFARRAKDLAEDLYTTREVADRLQVSVETVRDWIASGQLTAIDLGGRTGYRITKPDLEAFMQSRKKYLD